MKHQIEQVTERSQFDAVASLILDHSDESRRIFFPIHEKDRQASLTEMRERLWQEHTTDPSSTWIFIRHPSSSTATNGELVVVATCQWRIYPQSPFPADASTAITKLDAPWWTAGQGGRDFTVRFMKNVIEPRMKLMNRPHAGMSWIVVDPKFRRQGLGRSLVNWGLARFDPLNLESYIESSPEGAMLYRSCGYRKATRVLGDLAPRQDQGDVVDAQWKQLSDMFTPFSFDSYWRPARGVWHDGDPRNTWQERVDAVEFRDSDIRVEVSTDE